MVVDDDDDDCDSEKAFLVLPPFQKKHFVITIFGICGGQQRWRFISFVVQYCSVLVLCVFTVFTHPRFDVISGGHTNNL